MKDCYTAFLIDREMLYAVNNVCNLLNINRSQLIRHALRSTCEKYNYIFQDKSDFVIMTQADLKKIVSNTRLEVKQLLRTELQTATNNLTEELTAKIWEKISK